jgi:hypothetical protein
MDIKIQWDELCQAVRTEGETCAVACPARATQLRNEVAAFCAQPVPQSTPEMQMRQLSFTGIKGWWASRMPAKN